MMKKNKNSVPLIRPLSFKMVIALTVLFFTLSTLIFIVIINKKINPTLMAYAHSQTKNIATLIINDTIQSEVATQDLNNILTTTNGKNKQLEFDTQKVNQITSQITNSIQKNLKTMEIGKLAEIEKRAGIPISSSSKETLTFSAPLGIITKNAFFADKGPSIPIHIDLIGDVQTTIAPEITPYGINSVFVEIFVVTTVELKMIIPFLTESTEVTSKIPISMGSFEGEVPNFYNGMLNSTK